MRIEHYEDDHGTLALFDSEVKADLPPQDSMESPFVAVILDAKTGKTYSAKQAYAAYEENIFRTDGVDCWSLHHYFYAEHWCGCHRIGDIDSDDDDLGDGSDCPRNRFYVLSLTHPSLPGVLL